MSEITSLDSAIPSPIPPEDVAAEHTRRRVTVAQNSVISEFENRATAKKSEQYNQARADGAAKVAAKDSEERAARFSDVGKSVGKDIGGGILSTLSGREIAGGAIDSMNQVNQALGEFGTWVTNNPNLKQLAKDAALPSPESSGTVTGGFTRSISQFLTGSALLGAAGVPQVAATGPASYAYNLVRGGVVGGLSFDPHAANLANLAENVPFLKGPITDALKAKPDDPEWKGRLKSGLTGVASQAFIDALGGVVGIVRARQRAKAMATGEPAETDLADIQGQIDAAKTQRDEIARRIGDPDKPRVAFVPAGEKAPKGFPEPLSQDLGVDPLEIATALDKSKTTQQTGQVYLNWSRINGPEDIPKLMQDVADAFQSEVDVQRRGKMSHQEILARASGRTIRETRGGEDRFHGSSSPVDIRPGEAHYATMSIYGQGFYTTDAADIALGYTKKGRGANPSLYRVEESRPVQLYDLDEPLGNAERQFIASLDRNDGTIDSIVGQALEDNPRTMRQFYDAVREISAEERVPADEIQESVFYPIQDHLEAHGFGGITHTGGKVFGKKPHKVRVYFKPERDLTITKIEPDAVQETPRSSVPAIKATPEQQQGIDFLLERRVGQAFNAEELARSKMVYIASATALKDIKNRVVAEGGVSGSVSESTEAAFMHMLDVHRLIQGHFLGAQAEAGRALGILRSKLGASQDIVSFMKTMEANRAALQESSPGTALELAKRMSLLQAAGEGEKLESLIQSTKWTTTADAAAEAYYFNLLSSPKTIVRVVEGQTAVLGIELLDTKVANLVGRVTGNPQVMDGEALAQAHAYLSGGSRAFWLSKEARDVLVKATDNSEILKSIQENPDNWGGFWQAALTGQSPDKLSKYGLGGGERGAISKLPGAFGVKADSMGGFGASMQSFAEGVDTVARLPQRGLAMVDEVYKGALREGEMAKLAWRKAMQEAQAGKIAPDAVEARAKAIRAAPTEAMELWAQQRAEIGTFQNVPTNKRFKAFQDFFRNIPILGRIVNPFVRASWVIPTYAFEHTPLAPLTQRWRADYAAGGARQQMAQAKVAIGTMAFAAWVDLVLHGEMTGRGPMDGGQRQNMQRQGIPPNSIRNPINGDWVSYVGSEPLGTHMGLAATAAEVLMNRAWNDDDINVTKALAATSFAIGEAWTQGPFSQGLENFFQARGDPDRYAAKWFENLARTALVPNFARNITRTSDPFAREVNGMWDAVIAATPGMSKSLPLDRDLWGRPKDFRSGGGPLVEFINPVAIRQYKPEAIDQELERLQYWVEMPDRKLGFVARNGKTVTIDLGQWPGLYSRYVELSGNAATKTVNGAPIDPSTRKGLMDTLNMLVTGKHPMSKFPYDKATGGPDGHKVEIIRDYVRRYRDASKGLIRREYPALDAEIERRSKLLPPDFTFMGGAP